MSFLLSFSLFIFVSVAIFTIPGIFILQFTNQKFSKSESIILGTVVSFVGFTLISYLLILIHVDFLLIPLYILTTLFAFKKVRSLIKKPKSQGTKTILLSLVFVLGVIGQLAIIAPSGILNHGDILFWSANGHDGMWHIALMDEIKRGGILQNPIFAGERLVNYHFFSDIAPAMFSKYLRFNDLDLYFRFFPLLYSLLLGGTAFILLKKVTNSFGASIWAVFFTYFAGSFGFVVTYLKNKSIGGESIFWGTQIQSASGNPPQIISDFLVITYLYLFYLLVKKVNRRIFLLAVLLLGTLALFKVYAALALLVPTIIVGLWQLIRERKIYFLVLGGLSGMLAAALYLPNVSGTSFLIFQPWWYIRTMIVEPSRLDWIDHELRRQTYIYESNWKRVIYLESIGFFIFFFGNLGMRVVGLYDFFKYTKTSFKNYFNLLFVLTIIISFVFPLLFLQRGVASNTSQSLQYFILLFGLLAGISVNQLLGKIKLLPIKLVLAAVIIILSVPTQLGLINEFYSRPAYAKISADEITALSFIKESVGSKAVILTPPYNQYLNLPGDTPQIWDWFDTSYVAALSNHHTYFDDYEQVDIMGYDFESRRLTKEIIFNSENNLEVESALQSASPDIIYYPKVLAPKVSPEIFGFIKLYENDSVEIWSKGSFVAYKI